MAEGGIVLVGTSEGVESTGEGEIVLAVVLQEVNSTTMNRKKMGKEIRRIGFSGVLLGVTVCLTFFASSHYTLCARGVAQLAAHRVWDAGVGGSSPPTPTEFILPLLIVGYSPIEGS